MSNAPSEKGGRIFGYDLVKCVAMFLVVLIHYIFYTDLYQDFSWKGNLFAVLGVAGVPLFLAVNGALLFSRPFDVRKHYRKTLMLVAVVFAWRLISVFVMALIIQRSPFEFGIGAFVSYLFGGELGEDWHLGYFWFMYALIALYVIFPALRLCWEDARGRGVLLWVTACVALLTTGVSVLTGLSDAAGRLLGFAAPSFDGLTQLDPFGEYAWALVYFCAGAFLPSWVARIRELLGRKFFLAMAAGAVVAWLGLFAVQRYQAFAFDAVFVVLDRYTNPFTIALSFFLFAALSSVDATSPHTRGVMKLFGDNTLGVYFLHLFVLEFIGEYVYPVIGVLPIIVNLLIVAVLYVGLTFASYGLRKVPYLQRLFKV